MLYHNIYNSPDSRLAKRIIDEQQGSDDTFYANVQQMASVLKIKMDDIRILSKSQLKTLVKKRINERMLQLVTESASKKKMRFVRTDGVFSRKLYIQRMKGAEAIKTLKTRLNMIPIYGNYKGDVTVKRTCLHCKMEDDTTEHLISCKVFSNSTIKPAHLRM
jgi:hypothetical protein